MKLIFKKILLVLLFFITGSVVYADNYKVGVLATTGIDSTINRWLPTLDYLAEQLPEHSFQLIPLTIDKSEDAVRNKRIDFLLTSSGQFSVLGDNYNLDALAKLKDRFKDSVTDQFGAVIIARSNRYDIQSLQDLKGKKFAAVKENSFAGFQMAWYALKKDGVDPFTDLSKVSFMGVPADDVVLSVKNGIVDAGTVRSGLLEKMVESGKIKLDDFKILNQQYIKDYPFLLSTALYPEWPFVALGHVPEKVSAQVKDVLSNMSAEHVSSILSSHAGWSDDIDYQQVHEMLADLNSSYSSDKSFSNTEITFMAASCITLLSILYFVMTRVRGCSIKKLILPASLIFLLLLASTTLLTANYFIEKHEENIKNTASVLGKSLTYAFMQEISDKSSLNQLVSSNYKNTLVEDGGEVFPDDLREISLSSKMMSPDYEFLAIANSVGELVTVDGIRDPGEKCKAAITEFANSEEGIYPAVRVHGKDGHYHFDSMTHIDGKDSPIFFQSYNLNTLVKHFSHIENKDFEAIVVEQDNVNKVAFSAEGVGISLKFGESVSNELLDLALFETSIPSTNWRLIILPVEEQYNDYHTEVYGNAIAIVLFSVAIFTVFLVRLDKEEKVRIDLLQATNTDSLTGLPNRRYFDDYASMALLQAQRHNEKMAILYIDLDGFKSVNDDISHDAGDKVLRHIADKFRLIIRKNEFMARIGGDEFCLVVTKFKDQDELRNAAKRLIKSCAEKIIVNGVKVDVGLSIGIAIYPDAGESLQELVSQADDSMYLVKNNAKGSYAIMGEIDPRAIIKAA